MEKPGGRPTPLSRTVTRSSSSVRYSSTSTDSGTPEPGPISSTGSQGRRPRPHRPSTSRRFPVPVGPGVLGRVLQQLGDHHRQRGGDRGVQLAGLAPVGDAHRPVVAPEVLGHADQRRAGCR